jgi:hypothetical protein
MQINVKFWLHKLQWKFGIEYFERSSFSCLVLAVLLLLKKPQSLQGREHAVRPTKARALTSESSQL